MLDRVLGVGAEHLGEAAVVQLVRLRHRRVGELTAVGVEAKRERVVVAQRLRANPCRPAATAYGSVTLVSAYVEVCGTAPGMFATQ